MFKTFVGDLHAKFHTYNTHFRHTLQFYSLIIYNFFTFAIRVCLSFTFRDKKDKFHIPNSEF